MLLSEKSKAKKECKAISWVRIAKLLNSEGPSVRGPNLWNAVKLTKFISFKFIYKTTLLSFSGFTATTKNVYARELKWNQRL